MCIRDRTTRDNTNDHTFDGTIDNVKIYNGVTSIGIDNTKFLEAGDITFHVDETTMSVTKPATPSYNSDTDFDNDTNWTDNNSKFKIDATNNVMEIDGTRDGTNNYAY